MAHKVKQTGEVLLDGVLIGTVRKRSESYSGIRGGNGRPLGTYYYWDATDLDGRKVVTRTFKCTHCGGEVQDKHGKTDGGYIKPECLSCGHRYSYPDRPKRIEGPQFTRASGRYERTGASTRRDAAALLVAAYEAEHAND